MTLIPLLPQSTDLLVRLGESALRTVAVAGVAALVMALLPSKRAAVRLRVWTGVLYIALAMPLLGVVLPRLEVAIPGAWFGAHSAHPAAVPAELSLTAKEILVAAPTRDFALQPARATTHNRQQKTATKAVVAD